MKTQKVVHLMLTFSLLFSFLIGCVKKEDDQESETNSLGKVTDIDGNIYNTIVIGSQVWMKENLKTIHYRNGDPIPNVTDGTDWWHLQTGAYCVYDNYPVNDVTYGKLYNWWAVNSGLLAPAGWHVPSYAEWTTLENFLGNPAVSGGKLKETGTSHWQSPNASATNETGFTGLPGGFRSSTGSFYSITYNGYWWTTTLASDTSYAKYRFLDFNLGSVYGTEDYKIDGLSVRCIKD